MTSTLTNSRIDLARTGLLNFRAAAGSTVACERGLVWVTLEGEPDDYWLPAGESIVARRSGRVVVEAAQLSRIVLQKPAAARWATRLHRAVRWMRRSLTLQAHAV